MVMSVPATQGDYMQNVMSNDNYCVIFGWMCNELNLSGNELLVFAVIYGFSQDNESKFYGGRGYLSRTLNISKPTVDRALMSLMEKGYIIRTKTDRNGVVFHEYSVDLQVVKKYYHPSYDSNNSLPDSNKTLPDSNNSLPLDSNKTLLDSNKTLPNNKDILNSKNTNGKENRNKLFEDVLSSAKIVDENETLKDAFREFIKMRELIKKPLTEYALKRIVNKTFKIAAGDSGVMTSIINQSIEHCWQDVYPLKEQRHNATPLVVNKNPFSLLMEEENDTKRNNATLAGPIRCLPDN